MLDAARIPVVLLDRCILPFPLRSGYDLVGIDNRRAGYLATAHLLSTGNPDAAFLALEGSAPTVEARIAGYREALLTHGVAFDPERVLHIADFALGTVRHVLDASRSRAFVCASDRVAGRFLQALESLGYTCQRMCAWPGSMTSNMRGCCPCRSPPCISRAARWGRPRWLRCSQGASGPACQRRRFC